MIARILLIVGLGAAIGAIMGHFGQCSTGSCPLTANPFRGAIYGAVIGLLFSLTFFMQGGANMVGIDSKETFETALASDKLVVVDFFATWCGPCKKLAPIIEEVEQLSSEKALIIKVDVDKFPELAGQYNVQKLPTVVLIKDSNEVKRFVGVKNKDEYVKAIDELQ